MLSLRCIVKQMKKLVFVLVGFSIVLLSSGTVQTGKGLEKQLKTGIEEDFKTVKIGNQVWMARNLDVSTFRNGKPIKHVVTKEEWQKAWENGEPAWCYYSNDPENGRLFGKLYNWYAVNDSSGLAPAGWHVPTDEEWTTLTNTLGGMNVAGSRMKSVAGWKNYGHGTNESGFDALPAGARNFTGEFHYLGEATYWWSSTELSMNYAWPRFISFLNGTVERNPNIYYSKGLGVSVRLIKD
jgi:uncharacterized protein (TIGR02145 family)